MSEVNLKFKLIRDSRSNYGTNIYNLVNTYGTPFTVREVLMFVIEQNNCGIIEVVNSYMSENLPRLVFSKTQFIKTGRWYESNLGGYNLTDICPSEVESVRANVIWSELTIDYEICLKDPSVLNPSNIVKKVVMYDPRAHKIHYICAKRNFGRQHKARV